MVITMVDVVVPRLSLRCRVSLQADNMQLDIEMEKVILWQTEKLQDSRELIDALCVYLTIALPDLDHPNHREMLH